MARKTIDLEEVQRRVFEVHGDAVKIVPETYVGVRFKATFVDKDYGEWISFVTNVTLGHGHPKRGHLKSQETNLKKYGSISPLGSKSVRVKIEATNLQRYGHKNVLGAGSSVLEQRDQTMLDRYGAVNPQQVSEFREKTRLTNVERYGGNAPMSSLDVQQKSKDVCMEKYGVENVWSSPAMRKQIEETCMERYGVPNPAQSPEIYQKTLDGLHKITTLVHWKTGEKLKCNASYEVAFVEWCNENKIDFDWQIAITTPILTPAGRKSVYFIDAYVKSGKFENVWIELKGTFNRKNGHIGKAKWEWFHSENPNSLLATGDVLKEMGVFQKKVKGVMTSRDDVTKAKFVVRRV